MELYGYYLFLYQTILLLLQEFSSLIRPAFQALAIYLPLVTFYPLFKWLFTSVNESKGYERWY